MRETKHGAMTFKFRIGRDGTMDVTGMPANGSGADVFQRSGPYRLDGDRLLSPAVNDGRPVQVRLHAGILVLTIDETLVFQLRRA